MSDNPEALPSAGLIDRLRAASRGYPEWRVQHPVERSYCISFNRRDSIDPERDARDWLAEHRGKWPDSQFAGYEVACVQVQTADDLLMSEAADALGAAQQAATPTGDDIAVDSVAWAGFIKDYDRYNAGDPKLPFSELRASLAAVIHSARQAATPAPAEPPLLGRWHHGEGYLCSGSLRIARADFDTNPTEEFRDKVLDWMVETLNAELRRYAAPPATPAAGGPF